MNPDQITIFDVITPIKHLHHKADRETAIEGAKKVQNKVAGQCADIIHAAREYTANVRDNWNARELSDYSGIDYYLIQKRQSVICEKMGVFKRLEGSRDGKGLWCFK